MGILLRLTVPNPDDILAGYGAGALIRIERATTEDGVYAEIDTEPVVATQFSYEVWDPAGTSARWYRTRYSGTDTPSPSTTFSEYSAPFSPEAPAAYANLDDLLLVLETVPSSSKRLARLESLLTTATEELIHEMGGLDFRRHPAGSGDEVRYFGGDDVTGDTLHIHDGLISVTTVEVARTKFDAFETVDPADYVTEPASPPSGEPFFHLRLRGIVTWSTWPCGDDRLVRVTGAYGWSTVNSLLREITVERARQLAFADPSYSGAVPGESEYGAAPLPMRWPQALYKFLETEKWRFYGCSI